MSFDDRRFRDALGAFPTGVAVITGVSSAGERLGMTVSSFNSVSIAPPLVLFSVARRAHSFPAWMEIERYAVNILSQDQENISNRFARPLGDKWSDLVVIDGETGIPLLPNALASFECEAHTRFDGGDQPCHLRRPRCRAADDAAQAAAASDFLRRPLPAARRRFPGHAAPRRPYFRGLV